MSQTAARIPVDPRRERLLAVADLLGVHPAGAVMVRLLGAPAPALRGILAGHPGADAAADHLALLALFATIALERLADPDPEVTAIRLAAFRSWLATPSLAGPAGAERPLDRLADPAGVADAVRDLVAVPRAHARMRSVRVFDVRAPRLRPATVR